MFGYNIEYCQCENSKSMYTKVFDEGQADFCCECDKMLEFSYEPSEEYASWDDPC